jgi:mRNA interferase HigB
MMRLIGQDVLTKAIRRHSDARSWLQAWTATVQDAIWQNIDDLRDDYPSADGVKLKTGVVVTIFNVKGNEYRLLTNANYKAQIMIVLEFLTHAEYDKDRWKGRY